MSAVITAPFGDADAIRSADAAHAAFVRAARKAARESESARETALRVVLPKTATFAGHQGGLA